MSKTLHIILLVFYIFSLYGKQTLIKENKSISVWKYVENYQNYGIIDNISQKIYYISLYSDGNYYQFIEIIPTNPKSYTGVRFYELYGGWKLFNNQLILEEYGEKRIIDYNFFNSNFENIDNLIFQKK